jgi:2-phosphoglycerate kinase
MSETPLPLSLHYLAEANMRQLELVGLDPARRTDPSADQLYFDYRLTGRTRQRIGGSESVRKNSIISYIDSEEKELMREISAFNPGMILVRPEMYHNCNAFKDFLERNGFNVLFEADVELDIERYERLYEDAISIPDAQATMPTRTLVYTDSPCKLMVFADERNRYQGALADNFFEEFKGREGIYTPNTLRGDIVYQEARRLGYHELTDPVLADALDPFGAYRRIVQSPSGPHAGYNPEDRLLKYDAVGVHVPNYHELIHDLPIICSKDQLKEILVRLKYPYIEKFNRLWEKGEITTPLLILIGGYAGTGKSTLVDNIDKRIRHLYVAPTGNIRAILRMFISESDNPALYKPTYDLDSLPTDSPSEKPEIANFILQVKPIADCISQIAKFIAVERQNHIIDGNHVLPWMIQIPEGVISIVIMSQVSNEATHRKMIGGPSHNRTLTEEQFQTGRRIQEFIVQQARQHGIDVFEYYELVDRSLEKINAVLKEVISKTRSPDEHN